MPWQSKDALKKGKILTGHVDIYSLSLTFCDKSHPAFLVKELPIGHQLPLVQKIFIEQTARHP